MLSEPELSKLKRAYRQAHGARKRNAAATALLCALVGAGVTYLASASPLLGFATAVLSFIATLILTIGVYVLYEPAADTFEEFAEIMRE